MEQFIEFSAKNKNEAITKACIELGTSSDQLEIEVITEGSSGFFGFGSKPARIRVRRKEEVSEEEVLKDIVDNVKLESIRQPKKKETPKKEPRQQEKAPKNPEKKQQPAKEPAAKAAAPAPKAEQKEAKEAVKEAKEVREDKKESKENREPRPQKDRPAKDRSQKNRQKGDRPQKERRPENSQKEELPKDQEQDIPAAEQEKPVKESKPVVILTDENEIKEIEERAVVFLKDVFDSMELGEVEIKSVYNREEGCLDVDFEGDDMGVLIGKRGQTLDSLQYLTSLVVNKGKDNYIRVKLDTEDYRRRRKETLENLARGIAYKVKKTRKAVILEPMNPYERRIIHSSLQGNKYVETVSEGEDPYRHIVVKPKR